MKTKYLNYEETGFYSKLIVDYLSQKESIQAFAPPLFTKESVSSIIENRKKHFIVDRQKLSEILMAQYKNVELSTKTKDNITSLQSENTFTITTAHQLNLFTGPLYFIYKVLHCINLCEALKKQMPDHHFVPVFWMHTEDHDIEEINHFHLYSKTITWQTAKKVVSGSIPTEGLKEVIEEVKTLLGTGEYAQEIITILEKSFLENKTYAKGMFAFANALFGAYGIVLVDQHSPDLKKFLLPVLESDLLRNQVYKIASKTGESLEKAGYHVQAYPRPINLFYLDHHNKRNRIEYKEGQFNLVNNSLSFSETEILSLLKSDINRFSTNVLLRPLYQERSLPNLAYIGGGGELAYWMQLKEVFKHYDMHYPSLMLRNSVMWIDKSSHKKLNKLDISVESVFQKTDDLITQYVKSNTESEISLAAEKAQLENFFEPIIAKAKSVDATLEKAAIGEMTRQIKSLSNLEKKLLRAEKRNFETKTNQIRSIQSNLFPMNKLQERHDNFMCFWAEMGRNFFDTFLEEVNPWNEAFTVLVEE